MYASPFLQVCIISVFLELLARDERCGLKKKVHAEF